ncbi:MAG TPA: hypothetical protein VFL67_09225, partial [Mycobacterium sp.]|nr:hypothetical protein [Mycobacterium sp.]
MAATGHIPSLADTERRTAGPEHGEAGTRAASSLEANADAVASDSPEPAPPTGRAGGICAGGG